VLWNSAIGGAVIAAGASLLTLINSKETKVSEFRQQWIDALREDLATLISIVFEIKGEGNDDTPKRSKAIAKANLVATRIGLRLNEEENKSRDLQNKLADLRHAIHDDESKSSELTFSEVDLKAAVAIKSGQLLLKPEWNRVKQGEPTYKWTRRLALGSLALFSSILLVNFLRPDLIDNLTSLLQSWAGYHG